MQYYIRHYQQWVTNINKTVPHHQRSTQTLSWKRYVTGIFCACVILLLPFSHPFGRFSYIAYIVGKGEICWSMNTNTGKWSFFVVIWQRVRWLYLLFPCWSYIFSIICFHICSFEWHCSPHRYHKQPNPVRSATKAHRIHSNSACAGTIIKRIWPTFSINCCKMSRLSMLHWPAMVIQSKPIKWCCPPARHISNRYSMIIHASIRLLLCAM